jgi:hypothetical protein
MYIFFKSKAPFFLVGGSNEAAYFLRYLTAVFLGGLSGGNLIDWCQKGSAAVFWTRRGGRTDFYPFESLIHLQVFFLVKFYRTFDHTAFELSLLDPTINNIRQRQLKFSQQAANKMLMNLLSL